jgi:urease accessory protein
MKKLIIFLSFIIFIGIFGLFHGAAHGVEIPKAANPLLFVLGFVSGTITLHLFGVGIGYYSIKTKLASILLRSCGAVFASYGTYLLRVNYLKLLYNCSSRWSKT